MEPESTPESKPEDAAPKKHSSVVIQGTVAQDIELKTTESGKTFVNVLVAAHHVERDGQKLDAEEHKWHRATFWNEKAEQAAAQLKKGSRIELTAEQHLVQYEKDGTTRSATELRNARFEVRSLELKGMVAKDPELRTTDKGKVIARVLLAADEISKAGQRLDPEQNKWHVALFFGDRAKEIAAELKKNMIVDVVGEHQVRTFTDKTTGEQREVSELVSPKVDIRSLEIKGTVAKDPELQFTANEKPYTRILIAADQVTRGAEKLDPEQNKWHYAVCWGDKAKEAAKTFKKGMDVQVTGEQRVSQYEREGRQFTSSELHMPKIEPLQRQQQRSQGLSR
jgi:single-stranded DNA-binding protein